MDGKKPYVVVDDSRIKHNIEITELIDGCLDNQVVVVEMLSSPTIDSDAKERSHQLLAITLMKELRLIPLYIDIKYLQFFLKKHLMSLLNYQLKSFQKIKRIELILQNLS